MTQHSSLGRPLRPRGKLLQEDARRHHRSLLLQQLYTHGPASRADLARSTALTRVTVSDLISEMLADGFVTELGAPAESRVGKPPTLVGFNPDAAHIVCLDLSHDQTLTGAVLNLAGEVQSRRAMRLNQRKGASAARLVHRLASSLIESAQRPVLGIGVGSPGVVAPDGTVIDAPNLGWHETPLAESLSTDLGLPVYVANDANAAALGEHTFGEPDEGGLMALRVGRGVGAGLVLEGRLVHGHRSAAGEIGHVVVDPKGRPCSCGRTGCLETLLAEPHLRARLAERPGTAVLSQAGRKLGTVLAPVVSALNLHQVVLCGPEDLLGGALSDAAAQAIRRSTMAVIGDDLVVRNSKLGEDVVLVGAAVLVLSGELGVS